LKLFDVSVPPPIKQPQNLICSLQDCTVSGTEADSAIRVMHEDTKATFGKCSFQRAQGPLATVGEGAFAELLDCKVTESVTSVGVELWGARSRLEAERCTFARHSRCALLVHSGT
jgi:hypothetical protein